jgi:hypothetical protein
MTISGDVLRRHGIALTPRAFEAVVRAAVERLPVVGSPDESADALTPAERAALEAGGFDLSPRRAGEPDPLAASAAAFAALIASSLTVPQAARRLGVDGSRVRQRLAARTLYGIKLPEGWRLPLFQFDGDRLVAGISAVLPHLDPALHPLAVIHWFTLPDPDLILDDRPVSPRDWLRSGGDPAPVIALAGDL